MRGKSELKASVLINNYNYAAYVGCAVDSSLEQTHPSKEVVVVDDGSSDGSRSVLEQFCGSARIILQGNRGQAAAMNAAVRESRGEILCFLDFDDWWAPGKLAEVAAAFDADPEVVLVYHRLQPVRDGAAAGLKPVPRTLLLRGHQPADDALGRMVALPDDFGDRDPPQRLGRRRRHS